MQSLHFVEGIVLSDFMINYDGGGLFMYNKQRMSVQDLCGRLASNWYGNVWGLQNGGKILENGNIEE
jgi:hypothetical protein